MSEETFCVICNNLHDHNQVVDNLADDHRMCSFCDSSYYYPESGTHSWANDPNKYEELSVEDYIVQYGKLTEQLFEL